MPPTFKVRLPSSVKHLWKQSHRHGQRYTPEVIPKLVKLTIKKPSQVQSRIWGIHAKSFIKKDSHSENFLSIDGGGGPLLNMGHKSKVEDVKGIVTVYSPFCQY